MKRLYMVLVGMVFMSLFGCTIQQTNEIDNYLSESQIKENHILDLRSKWLTTIPNICKDYSGEILLNIWSIDLWDNQIKTINTDLSCLKNLRELNLSYNKISKIKNLNKIITLETLYLQKNNISKISWLEELVNLKKLNLSYNKISKVEWLSILKQLHWLELQHNQIQDISELVNMDQLVSLKLEFNKIKNETIFDMIENMKNLQWISLWENQLPIEKINDIQNKVNK